VRSSGRHAVSGFQPVGNFTIVDGGKAVEIILAVPGNMNAFTLYKQS
jgi:hypothetical protein